MNEPKDFRRNLCGLFEEVVIHVDFMIVPILPGVVIKGEHFCHFV